MATYAIGDVQGCQRSLEALLERVGFDPAHDRLWFTGDLVNRGPRSLETLRWAHRHRGALVAVLGNHDLHCLARHLARVQPRPGDTLDALLASPDRGPLLDWLLHLPLAHAGEGYAMVHAGLLPAWSVPDALRLAGEASSLLRENPGRALRELASPPLPWSEGLQGWDRFRTVAAALTRLRYCTPAGEICSNQEIADRPRPECLRWYAVPGRRSADADLLFGHWSTLGYRELDRAWCLDSGCVWGRSLTAFRLDDRRVFSVGNAEGDQSRL